MSNLVAFSLSGSTIPGTFQAGNVAYATASAIGSGSSNLTWGYEVYAVNGYTFITDSYTQSYSPSLSATPLFYNSATTSSEDILNTINRLPDRVDQTAFINENTALNWVSGSGKYVTLLNGSLYPEPLYTTLAGSLLFNGSSQYLSMAPGFALSTGAYTIEGWFYNNSNYTAQRALVAPQHPGGATNALSLFTTDAQSFSLDAYGGGGVRGYNFPVGTLQINKWLYIILNRNSDQRETMWVGTFVNADSSVTCNRATSATGGTSIIGGTQINNLNYSGVCNNIGRFYGGFWPGYITNFRATVGTAVYDSTSSTIIAPTAPLTVLANTKYLMLGAVVTTDSSGVQTVTNNNGVTQSSVLKPF